jgi:hypothetical protein
MLNTIKPTHRNMVRVNRPQNLICHQHLSAHFVDNAGLSTCHLSSLIKIDNVVPVSDVSEFVYEVGQAL